MYVVGTLFTAIWRFMTLVDVDVTGSSEDFHGSDAYNMRRLGKTIATPANWSGVSQALRRH